MALGWLIGLIVAAILGTTLAILIGTMNKKVVPDKRETLILGSPIFIFTGRDGIMSSL
ncbi:hypothetical protein GCM10008986_24940 [Salinibacillus aidingensis]|uniref:Uncharacterized protein n=1 Tax=Salinibacillus aidingensis TaxID=237684 RepID=A0ABN1BG20_9BACI